MVNFSYATIIRHDITAPGIKEKLGIFLARLCVPHIWRVSGQFAMDQVERQLRRRRGVRFRRLRDKKMQYSYRTLAQPLECAWPSRYCLARRRALSNNSAASPRNSIHPFPRTA